MKLGACEGLKEDTESWKNFFVWLKSRGLSGVRLITGDKAMGMVEIIGEVFPNARYQRCTVHFYRNVFTVVPKQKMKDVAKMLKAYVFFEFFTGISSPVELAEARNQSIQVDQCSIEELNRSFEPIKAALKKESFYGRIAFKQNEHVGKKM